MMPNQMHRQGKRIRDEADNATARVDDAVGEVMDSARRLGSEAGHMVRDQVEGLRDTAAGYVEQGRRKAIEVEGSVESRIREQPLQAVLLAAGIGFALGFLFTRR